MAVATTFDLPNYVGELFSLSVKETPLLSMIGGLTGGVGEQSKEFTWQDYSMVARSQPNILEAAAPVSSQRARTERKNVVQIYQYGVDISYTKLAAVGQLGTPAAPATSILGNQPVRNELSWQLQLKIEQAAMDANFTAHVGVFQNPTDNLTARRSRGLLPWITTNAVAAGATALSDTLIDQLLRTMHQNGARFSPSTVIFVDIFQKQSISGIYGYAPEHRNVGGVNIQMIETDVAPLGVVIDRDVPDDTFAVYDLMPVEPRFLAIPGKGHFFTEPMAKTKASEELQLYGELGWALGPETWHGKITGLTTS